MSARLAYVINDGPFFVSHFLPHAVAARAAGFEVHVIVPPSSATATMTRSGLTVHTLPMTRSGRGVMREARSFAELYRLFKTVRPGLVHLITIKPVIYGGVAARLAAVSAAVSSVTGLGYVFLAQGRRAAVLRFLVRHAYRIALGHPNLRALFENSDDRDLFVRDGLVRRQQTSTVRGAGVDIKVFVPTEERHGAPLVVLPARLLRDKGVYEFVAAAESLRANGVQARFALVGDHDPANPSAVPLAQLESWRKNGPVEWWGRRDDMPMVFSQAHIVCLPSYREGLPKALVEASACARAIVSTDVPGCREIVGHEDNGLLVPARDSRALAQAIERLLVDPALRARLGRRGRDKVEQEFSLQAVNAQMLATYRSLLGYKENSDIRT